MTHCRHGARASIFDGDSDYMKEYWKVPKELTGVGERMHYLLGLRNRERYIKEKKLLSEKFNTNELKVISTGVKRTIVSVLSQLQGLYPQKQRLGEILNESQLKMSNPPIIIDYKNIQDEITELNDNALPETMTLIPLEIRNSSSFLTAYDQMDCQGAINASSTSMTDNMDSLTNEFNEKYAKYMNQFKGIPSQYKYNFSSTAKICDTYIACYSDGRNMSEFRRTGIN
jgi:acid phosphatase/lysosomal acid phosphatase/prostatic aicd phosphatase